MTNELYHHGVKGQSWGKRNGPPYPLYRKSAYYKKTGKRPPGYTGDKKGKSDSGSTNKSGKIGGVKDHLLANSIFDKSDTGRESYRENLKGKAKTAAGMGIGAGVGAGIGAGVAALRKGNIKEGAVYGGLAGSALGSLAGTRSYIKSLKLGAKRHKEIREADRAKKGRIGGLPNENTKDNNTRSEAERKAKLKRRILIGAGIAAGVAGGALLGRKLYRAKAAQGAAGVESAAKELHSSFLKNRAAQTEASAIKANLGKAYQNSAKAAAAERAGIVNKKLSLQNEALGLKDKKGIRAFFNRRKNSKALREVEQKLAANSTKSANAKLAYERNLANNAFAANHTNANYEKAKKIFERSKSRENALKRIGNRQAITSTLGLGVVGGATGYGISKIANRRNQKARIQNRRKKRR